ncbi:unnamed protein product [Auanema sp. JU1783]|nr:unnamed protein product [Auanema sp. JU1783]
MEDMDVDHLLTVSFNQDAKSLAVGHADGYNLYMVSDVLDNNFGAPQNRDTSSYLREAVIVERLFLSSLIIVVSQKDRRVLHVYHTSTKEIIVDLKFNKPILNAKLNRERLVVCLDEVISIYSLKEMKLLHSIVDTPVNRLGLVDLSACNNAYLAYPGETDSGNVNIFDAQNLQSVNNFAAHDAPLAAIKFNAEGTLLATASTKGTVIRVFSVPQQGTKLFEFRRGMSRCVTIHSLAFSCDSSYLCSSSNTETVHVFKLEKQPEAEREPASDNSWFGYLTQAASSYLPTQVNELITVERSFATARLPGSEKKNIAAMPTINGQTYLLVATTDGFLYCYKVEPDGGECNLVKQQRIGPRADMSTMNPDLSAHHAVLENNSLSTDDLW